MRVPKRCRRRVVGGGAQEPIEAPRHFETLFLVDEILSWIAASRAPQRMRVKETLLRRFFNRGGSFGYVARCPASGLAYVWAGV